MTPDIHQRVREFVQQRLAPWCKCICREAPDGTMCKLCGHVHQPAELAKKGLL